MTQRPKRKLESGELRYGVWLTSRGYEVQDGSFYFSPVMGIFETEMQAKARAAFLNRCKGCQCHASVRPLDDEGLCIWCAAEEID